MKKLFLALICICLLLSLSVPASAAQKKQTTHAIAIVFDNSGSMFYNAEQVGSKINYVGQKKEWCRALYATEVFASMANKGDEIRVIPMNEVSINGRRYSMDSPIIIKGGDDVSFLRNMKTLADSDTNLITPIESISVAHKELGKMQADEKWLVVLTDGDVFYEGEANLHNKSKSRLESLLKDYNTSENIIYLGVGSQTVKPDVKKNGIYRNIIEKADKTEDVLRQLTGMCNAIYGRDELPSSGSEMSFDLPMDKLILFIQGSDISDVQLLDQNGQKAADPVGKPASPKYGIEGVEGRPFDIDDELSGTIVTYENIPAGDYRIHYSGSGNSVSAYYEPNVSLTAYLEDSNGVKVSDFSHIYPGTYRLHYGLADSKGEMTESPLLGDRRFTVTYSIDGNQQSVTSNKNDYVDIDLNEGNVLEAVIDAAYLSGYSITKDMREEWPGGGIDIQPWPVGSLELKAEGGSSSYAMLELEDKGVYNILAYYEGQMLDIDRVKITSAINGEGGPQAEYSDGVLRLKYNGSPKDTLAGKYSVSLNGSYVDEHDKTVEAAAQIVFEVAEIPAGKLELKISGADEELTIPDLEAKGVFSVEAMYDGKPVTDLENLDIKASVAGDNAPDLEYKEGKIYLKYHNSAEDTGSGDFEITVTGSYKNEYGIVSDAEAVSKPFKISEARDKLEIEYDLKQDYYVVSSLDKAEPVRIRLKKNGTPLQGEELAAADVKVDTGGVGCEVKLSEDRSCYEVRLNSKGNKDRGKHVIHTTAGIKDEVGRAVNTEKDAAVKFGTVPRWIKWAIAAGALALIAAAVFAYLNQKILPDQINIDPESVSFIVGGKNVQGQPVFRYTGKGKRKGTLTVQAPSYPLAPMAQASIRIDLEAVDPRRTKSSRRKASVVSRAFPAPTDKVSATIGPKDFSVDHGVLVMDDVEPGAQEPHFNISNGNSLEIVGRCLGPNGRSVNISFSVDLKFT